MSGKITNQLLQKITEGAPSSRADAEPSSSSLSLPTELPEGFLYTADSGLTTAEAENLKAQGLANRTVGQEGKPLKQILYDNIFTLFNLLNVGLAVALLLVGSYRNMTFILIIIFNTIIGTYQEYRAQKTIQELKLLNVPEVTVLRDGKEVTLKPEETVRGDLTILRGGDQVTADCVVVSGSGSAMESLLTGESDAIRKQVNSWLYSGSYVTEGRMVAQQVYVADESYAGRLTREAKKTARPESRLMTDLNRLIRFDSMVLIPLGILLLLKQTLISHLPLTSAVPSTVAAMIGMIPEGLMLLTSIAMAVGVIKLGRRKTLVQELAGIETLARADILCLDKTGTITTGEMELEAIEPWDRSEEETRQALSRFLGAFDEKSDTLDALRRSVPPGTEKPKATLPFSSKRKKSAATFQDGQALIMGAPEFVLGDRYPEALRARAEEIAAEGRRVLVLAGGVGIVAEEAMPEIKTIFGLMVLTDCVRPHADETLAYFRKEGVTVKVISGDHPTTVARIARQAGLEGWEASVDATTLKTDEEIADACERYTVFGRVTPEQKKALVLAMQAKGHNVAMTGDGVNDIPALKAADCSIAMAGGADAARHAAQLTLLDSDFSVMPEIVLEGRRVINNITRAASLFLTKTLFSFFLSLLTLVLADAYPFQPIHLTLISGLMIGFPGFVLALEPSEERIRGEFLRTVLLRALPGGAAVALCATLAMLMSGWFGFSREECETIATLVAGIICYAVLIRTCIPVNRLRAGMLALVAIGFVLAYLFLHQVFFLVPLSGKPLIALAALSAFGCVIAWATAFLMRRNRKE